MVILKKLLLNYYLITFGKFIAPSYELLWIRVFNLFQEFRKIYKRLLIFYLDYQCFNI